MGARVCVCDPPRVCESSEEGDVRRFDCLNRIGAVLAEDWEESLGVTFQPIKRGKLLRLGFGPTIGLSLECVACPTVCYL